MRIGVHGVPGVVVKDGVVDAIGTAGANVSGGHADVLEEWGEVGAGAEIAHADIAGRGRVGGAVLIGFVVGAPGVVNGAAGGTGNGLRDLADEFLERGDGGGGEVGAGDGDIDVEVGDGLLERPGRAAPPTRLSR